MQFTVEQVTVKKTGRQVFVVCVDGFPTTETARTQEDAEKQLAIISKVSHKSVKAVICEGVLEIELRTDEPTTGVRIVGDHVSAVRATAKEAIEAVLSKASGESRFQK